MSKVIVYRHKVEKDLYLARDWTYRCGNDKTPFYFATYDIIRAIQDANTTDTLNHRYDFCEFIHFAKEAKITKEREFDFDGYKGVLKKEFVYPISEFEKITLSDGSGNNESEESKCD